MLVPSGGGRKAHLLEDKQIPSVGVFDEDVEKLSGGHFIGRLAAHFGLVSDQGLRGLLVVVNELSVIDLDKLAGLNICSSFGDTWAWVAPKTKRQQTIAAGAPRAAEDAPTANEGAQAIPALIQAPQPLPPAL
ncbi:hypothetical protein Tco_0503488 [Tanacetum coccineum]